MKLVLSARRKRAYLSQFSTTHLHLRHPLVVAFFSFSFPVLSNLMQHRYATAFILIVWEPFINTKAHVNTGILYSLLGDFEKAKAVLDERWLMFYVAIYMYGIWDSYRGSVDLLGSIYGYVLAWGANHLGHYRSGGWHRAGLLLKWWLNRKTARRQRHRRPEIVLFIRCDETQ
ncbi:hypothetical protein V2J23_06380 [Geobacillus thermoleovorans]|uniref:hypothetical protein n=1 Tax=Geobacillus thermoleovorans TaxID=33941 RepID=UPI00345BCAD9